MYVDVNRLYTITDPCEEDLLTIAKLEEELKEAKEQACPGEGIYTVPGKNWLSARFTLIILFCISPIPTSTISQLYRLNLMQFSITLDRLSVDYHQGY